MADLDALKRQLRDEGFGETFVWQDGPDKYYPDHIHDSETVHIILEGQMTLTAGGQTRTFTTGQRCDVPARAVHSARMGPQGCRYLIGEK